MSKVSTPKNGRKLGEVVVITPENANQFLDILGLQVVVDIQSQQGLPTGDMRVLRTSSTHGYITFAKLAKK